MTRTKALLLALLLVLGMIVSPAFALGYDIVSVPFVSGVNSTIGKVSNITVDLSQDGRAIQRILVDVGTGTVVDFTLWYGNGETVSGQMEYRNSTDCADWVPWDAFCQYSGVSIGSDSQGYSYRGAQEIGRIDVATYARNWTSNTEYTTGFIVYDSVFGVSERRAMAYYPVLNGTTNIVYKFSIVSTRPVVVTWTSNTFAEVSTGLSKNVIETAMDWKKTIEDYSGSIFGFISSLFSLIILFFIGGNLLLIVVIWMAVTMAYSAMSSVTTKGFDPFRFYKKFFGFQRTFIQFLSFLWTTLVTIVGTMVQALLKWL